MGIVRWSNPSTRRRCRRLSTPPAVLVQSHQQLPRQLAEVSGATTPGFSGPLPSLPSCFESSSFCWSVFGSPPLCVARSVFGSPPLRSIHHCPVPAFPLTHSPRREVVSGAGSHEGCPPHGFWASPDGGVVSAVIPCPLRTVALLTQSYPAELEETLLQLGLATSTSRLSGLECGTTPAGALDVEELWPIELLECGTTPAGALDHEELFGIERERRPVPQIADKFFRQELDIVLVGTGLYQISTTNQAAPALGL